MEPWHFRLQAERLIAKNRDGKPHPSGSGGVAAHLRTAISRAYYSIFLTSRSFLDDLGYEVTSAGACHGVVHRALIECGKLDRAASDYATLGEYRRKVDYQMSNVEVEELDRAEELLRCCSAAYTKIEIVREKARTSREIRAEMIAAIDEWRDRDGIKEIWKKV